MSKRRSVHTELPTQGSSNSLLCGSDFVDSDNICEQCDEFSKTVDAAGFCLDCNDYLCKNCIKQHKILRVSKRHIVLEGNDLPERRPSIKHKSQCPVHPGNPIELYCPQDDALCCMNCYRNGHTSCPNVGTVNELAKDVETSQEFPEVLNALQNCGKIVRQIRDTISRYHTINEIYFDTALKDFKSFKIDMEARLAQQEEHVAEIAKEMKLKNQAHLENISEKISSLDKEIDNFMSEMTLEQKLKLNEQLYIALKQNAGRIHEVLRELDALKVEIKVDKYGFRTGHEFQQLLDENLYATVVSVLHADVTHVGDIDMNMPDDKCECGVCDLVEVSDNRIVLIDYNNSCLKLLDLAGKILVQKLSTQCPSRSVTLLADGRIAATVPDLHQILFFEISKLLQADGIITVDGQCLGIASVGAKLVVSYKDPGKVQVMNISGLVYQTITTDPAGNSIFDVPRYVRLSADGTNIYVSDWKVNSLTCLNIDGSFKWKYTSCDLRYPQGVETGHDDTIYICDRYSNTVHVLSLLGIQLATIPTKPFDVRYPAGICFRNNHRELFLTSWSAIPTECNILRILRMS